VVACALLIPAVLVAGWVVADAVQRPTFSPVRQTVSVAAGHGGDHRWVMTSALFAVGLLYLALAAGFRALRPAARAGLVVAGVAAAGIALCPEPAAGSTFAHQVCTAVGEVAIAVWPVLAVQRTHRRWPTSAGLGLAGSVLCLGLFGWLVSEVVEGGALLGLVERASASTQVAWPAVVAVGLRGRRLVRDDTAEQTPRA
jgi:hypothetical membrane protein